MYYSEEQTYNKQTMDDINNETVINAVYSLSNDFAAKIMCEIETSTIYNNIISILPKDKVYLYFLRWISQEIGPYVLKMIIIKRNLQLNADNNIYVPEKGIFYLLKKILVENENPVRLSMKQYISHIHFSAKETLKKVTKEFLCRPQWWSPFELRELISDQPKIAVHLLEGIDLKKRSDLIWFPNAGIDANRVLVCITIGNIYYQYYMKNKMLSRRENTYVPDYILKGLEELGMKWVFIGNPILPRKTKTIKKFPVRWKPDWLINLKAKAVTEVDRYVYEKTNLLVEKIQFWKTFYQIFNVKLDFFPDEGAPLSIAKGIAFDIMGDTGGFTVGKQRSEFGSPPKAYIGFYTQDIFFTWNYRAKSFLKPEYNQVKTHIVAGYPNDMNFFKENKKVENVKRRLKEKGVEFVVALFDTGFGLNHTFLAIDMEAFYREFLNWILEDTSVGLVIKSKKPHFLDSLPNVLSLLFKAEASGRCVNLTEELGSLPSDASRIADIAVGAGVSSAVSEAVIAGCRGCHYQKNFPRRHDYYKWGYETLVFDNLDRMMKAIKSFKADPDLKPELGDWTPFLDKLDPFRDGRAGERMGNYMRWFLEEIEAGQSRDQALKNVNSKYAAVWGGDKIIQMNV